MDACCWWTLPHIATESQRPAFKSLAICDSNRESQWHEIARVGAISWWCWSLGSQHPSPNEKTFCKFEPQIWLEFITSRDAKSACFQGSRTSCREIFFGIFWPSFGQKRSHHVMDASCRIMVFVGVVHGALLFEIGRRPDCLSNLCPPQNFATANVQKHQKTPYDSKTARVPFRYVIWRSLSWGGPRARSDVRLLGKFQTLAGSPHSIAHLGTVLEKQSLFKRTETIRKCWFLSLVLGSQFPLQNPPTPKILKDYSKITVWPTPRLSWKLLKNYYEFTKN